MVAIENEKTPASQKRTRHTSSRILFQALIVSFLLLSSVLGWAYLRTGSAALIPRFLNGEQLLVDPMIISLGAQEKGATAECSLRVVNATRGEVTLVGAQRSCACITVDQFPLSIPPGRSRELQLVLHVGVHSGQFEESVKFFTDYAGLQAFAVRVSGVAR